MYRESLTLRTFWYKKRSAVGSGFPRDLQFNMIKIQSLFIFIQFRLTLFTQPSIEVFKLKVDVLWILERSDDVPIQLILNKSSKPKFRHSNFNNSIIFFVSMHKIKYKCNLLDEEI